jgi:hypothetical protein
MYLHFEVASKRLHRTGARFEADIQIAGVGNNDYLGNRGSPLARMERHWSMQTVFLSYASENLDDAQHIEEQLVARGVKVWRDREQLRAGARWPKALGEAIAASDVLLLLWSDQAAASVFVELEWCTALALKKTIFTCLLGDAPLPASLAAIEALQLNVGTEAVERILLALADETKPADHSLQHRVICKLAEIGPREPPEVLRQARAAFSQDRWAVQGSVYQAAGDIHFGSAPPAQKTLLETWQARVAIIAGVLTIITLGIQLVRSNVPAAGAPQTVALHSAAIETQSIAGSIWDEEGEPLSGVDVSVLLGGRQLAKGNTNSVGIFSFQVPATSEAEVTLIAQRARYRTEKRYAHLGNLGFNFKMQKKAE